MNKHIGIMLKWAESATGDRVFRVGDKWEMITLREDLLDWAEEIKRLEALVESRIDAAAKAEAEQAKADRMIKLWARRRASRRGHR